MRLFFLWPFIFTMVLLIGLSNFYSFLRQGHIEYKLPIHKILYLEDNISIDQLAYIEQAVIEWSDVTNGDVSFEIRRLPESNIDISNAVIITNIYSDFPDVIMIDYENNYSTLGYFKDDQPLHYIALVEDRITDKEYTAIIMHELGHALGLEHLKGVNGIGTLMYPGIELGSNHITKTDLFYFCKLYHCDASKYHGVP